MFSSASNIVIAGGSFNVAGTPQVSAPPRQVIRSKRPPIHIYEQHLSTEGRGHPLWLPDPSWNLPPEYRAQGVSIGDVGIIKSSGAFDFFFNINHPASHPINSRCPADFQPLDPPLQEHDIDKNDIFIAGSSLASSSIRRVQGGSLNGGLEFESSASEGAILAMPDATFQSDLNDLDRFYQHIGTHAESWYRYANGPGMGRRLDNSGLCLVIGCDKTKSWGIATFSSSMEQTTSRLQFLPAASSPGEVGCSYTWEHSGTADSPRVGPSRREPLGQSSHNQCLFVRYLTFQLRKSALPRFRGPMEVQIQMDSHQSTLPRNARSNSQNLSSLWTFGSALTRGLRSAFGPKENDAQPEPTEDLLEIVAESYMVSEVMPLSTYLNDYLLEKVPAAKVAATHGVEWYSRYRTGANPLRTFSDVIASILHNHKICLSTSGVAYFQPNDCSKSSSSNCVVSSLSDKAVDHGGPSAVAVAAATEDIKFRPAQTRSGRWKHRIRGRNTNLRPVAPSEQRNLEAAFSDLSKSSIISSSPPSEVSSIFPRSPMHSDDNLLNQPGVLTESDIIIAVMGPTGSGKSTFINKVAGIEIAVVGHELESCTQDVQAVRCVNEHGRQVVLLDTPGFDDTNLSDLEILQRIADWLRRIYENGITLSGLLFFHRISDNRISGSPMKLLETFQNICGRDALVNVILVTTMWDEVTDDEGEMREMALCTRYWKTMIASGSRTARFFCTPESGWDIISRIDLQTRRPLLLQRELVDLKKGLRDTAAGRSLYRWLLDILETLSKTLESVRRSEGRKQKDVTEAQVKSYRDREAALRSVVRNWSDLAHSESPDSPPVELYPTTNAQMLRRAVTILKLIERLIAMSSIPVVQKVVGAVITVVGTIEKIIQSVDEYLMILASNACSMIANLIEITDAGVPPDVQATIQPLLKDLRDIQTVLWRLSQQRSARKHHLGHSDRQAIEEFNRKLVIGYGRLELQVVCVGAAPSICLDEKLDRLLERLDSQLPSDLETLKEAHRDVLEYRSRWQSDKLLLPSLAPTTYLGNTGETVG